MKMEGRLFRRMPVFFPASHSMCKKGSTPQLQYNARAKKNFKPNIKLPSVEAFPDPNDEKKREKWGWGGGATSRRSSICRARETQAMTTSKTACSLLG